MPDHTADAPAPAIPAHVAAVIDALADYRRAEVDMRRRTRDSMRMGATDLQALKFLLKAQQENRVVSGRALSDHLGMTSASVTTMLDRLAASGHVQRMKHPTDRRSMQILATPGSHEEVRQTLGAMHRGMLGAATGLSAAQTDTVIAFLGRLTASADTL